jgi:hypothetical protein
VEAGQAGLFRGHGDLLERLRSNAVLASVLKGRGFSRADKTNKINGALAPEGLCLKTPTFWAERRVFGQEAYFVAVDRIRVGFRG